MPPAENGEKPCPQCGNVKRIDQFYPSKSRSDGLYPWCKTCCRIQHRKGHAKRKARGPKSPAITSKLCPDCGETKPATEFYVSRFVGPDGLSYCCKTCDLERRRRKAGITKVSTPVRPSNGLKTCPKCREAKPFHMFHTNRRRKDHLDVWCKECNRRPTQDRYFRNAYGITLEQYEALSEKQAGLCDICSCEETHVHLGKISRLSVDHDHSAEKNARGLLCNRCNHAISGLEYLLKNDLLDRATRYLQKHSG